MMETVLKQGEIVQKLEETLTKEEPKKGKDISEHVDALKRRVSQLELSLKTQKKTPALSCPSKEKACKKCDETFSKKF